MDARVALPMCLLLAVLDQSVWGQGLTTTNYEDNDDTTTPEFPDITADIVTGKVSITNTSEEYTINIEDSLTTNATESYPPTSDDDMVTDATTIYDNPSPESTTPTFDAITHSRTITEDASAVTARTQTNPQQSGTVSEVDSYTSSQNPKFSSIGVQKPSSKSLPKPSPASRPSQRTPGAKTTSVPVHSTNKQVTTLEKSTTTRPDTGGQTTACTTQTGKTDEAEEDINQTALILAVSLAVVVAIVFICCISMVQRRRRRRRQTFVLPKARGQGVDLRYLNSHNIDSSPSLDGRYKFYSVDLNEDEDDAVFKSSPRENGVTNRRADIPEEPAVSSFLIGRPGGGHDAQSRDVPNS
ncbi:hypothetical protein ScPMuIL_009610 [Solemya velum]